MTMPPVRYLHLLLPNAQERTWRLADSEQGWDIWKLHSDSSVVVSTVQGESVVELLVNGSQAAAAWIDGVPQ